MADTNTFEISSEGGKSEYRIETVGLIDRGKSQLNDHDDVGDHHVEGHVWGGTDKVVFPETIRGFKPLSGFEHAKLRYNGRPVKPFHLNQRKLTIKTPADAAPYTVAVDDDGRIIGSEETEPDDCIYAGGSKADGFVVEGGKDVWYLAGLFQGIDSNQPLNAKLDGKDVGGEGNPPTGIE